MFFENIGVASGETLCISWGMFMPFSYTLEELGAFRQQIYTDCLTARSDALFELGDALLTLPYLTSPVALSLSPSFRRKWSSGPSHKFV